MDHDIILIYKDYIWLDHVIAREGIYSLFTLCDIRRMWLGLD